MFEKIQLFLEKQKRRLLALNEATEETGWLTERERSGQDFVLSENLGGRCGRPVGAFEMLLDNSIAWIMKNADSVLVTEFMRLSQPGAISEDTTTSAITTFTTSLLPAVRRIYNQLIAKDLVSVQPLSGASGYIFWIDHIFSDNKAGEGITGGTTKLSDKQSSKTYTDAGEKESILGIQFQLKSKLISTESKKVLAGWTLEAEQDLLSQWRLNLEAELMPRLTDLVVREIDNKIMAALLAGAGAGNVNWNKNAPAGDTTTADKNAYNETLFSDGICAASKLIHGAKKMLPDWMVMNHNTFWYLERLNNFVVDPKVGGIGDVMTSRVSRRYVGTLNGMYRVFVNTEFDDDKILMGVRGADWTEAVGYYAPYIPLYISEKYIASGDFSQFLKGVQSRYAYGVIPESQTQDPVKNNGLATVTLVSS